MLQGRVLHTGLMLRRVFVLAVTLLSAAGMAACTGKDAVGQSPTGAYRFNGATERGKTINVADRKKVGPITGTLLAGGTFNLDSTDGSVTLINLYASWCVPCQTETPQLVALHDELKSKNITFIGVATKENSASAAKSFVADQQIDYPVVNDEQARIPLLIGNIPVVGLPETIILDKQHRVAAVYASKVLPADVRPVLTGLAAES